VRAYLESHPWITFEATDVNDLNPKTWMLLGEARAMCQALAGVTLPPERAAQLYQVSLVRGAQATTAIEGNTLTQAQVSGILDGTYRAPPSRSYQEREVVNVLEALQSLANQALGGTLEAISAGGILEFNKLLLDGTEHEPDAVPGRVRSHDVVVGNYRGPPAEDCRYLLEQLAQWLESDIFLSGDPDVQFALDVARAVYAHLYIAWIHPFGDGNGRTARLLEFLILARSGLPLPATHLLSNHYNLTRDRYYRELRNSSRSGRTDHFLTYAIEGLIDGLRDQVNEVRDIQLDIAWVNYVHEVIDRFPASVARDRQRALVLAMPPGGKYSKAELPLLTAELAASYATVGPRTLSRDLNRLQECGLLLQRARRWVANHDALRAFVTPAVPAATRLQ